MQYAVLLYDDERQWQDMTPEAAEELMDAAQPLRRAKVDELGGSGHRRGAADADRDRHARVRWTGDDVTVVGGPVRGDRRAVRRLLRRRPARPRRGDRSRQGPAPPDGAAPDGRARRRWRARRPRSTGDVYAVLLYGDEEPWLRATPAGARRDVRDARPLRRRGASRVRRSIAAARSSSHSSTATTMRQADGDVRAVSDGPFAETAEQLTGFYLVRAPGGDRTSSKLLDLLPGEVTEIRPTIDHSDRAAVRSPASAQLPGRGSRQRRRGRRTRGRGRLLASTGRGWSRCSRPVPAGSTSPRTACRRRSSPPPSVGPIDGVPDNPPAWLLTTARRRLIDRVRSETADERRLPKLVVDDGRTAAGFEDVVDDDLMRPTEAAIDDERLRMLFVGCHPALDVEPRGAHPALRRRADRGRDRPPAARPGTDDGGARSRGPSRRSPPPGIPLPGAARRSSSPSGSVACSSCCT